MFIPIVLALVLGYAGYKVGHDRKKVITTRSGAANLFDRPGAHAGMIWNPVTQNWVRAPKGYVKPASSIQALDRLVGAGQQPEPQLIQAALTEAMVTGNAQIEQLIYQLFGPPPYFAIPSDPQVSGDGKLSIGGESLPESGDVSDWGELANPSQAGSFPPIASQKQSTQANDQSVPVPIPGITGSGWGRFVAALRTRKPAYASESHLGAFEHNRRRLKKLGISEDDVTDDVSQYKALCTDLVDYWNQCQALVTGFTGSVVDVGDVKVPVTRSGILGLLKAAGPKGAESWLSSPDDRTKFPRTTETFSRCNGCF